MNNGNYNLPKHGRRKQQGSILVFTAIAAVTLLLVLGLIIDSSMLWGKRRDASSTADSAALAGAMMIYNGSDDGSNLDTNPVACSAALNGDRAAVDEACELAIELGYPAKDVQIAIPPLWGELAGPAPSPKVRLQVYITAPYQTSFMQLAGNDKTQATARATAEVDIHEGAPPPVNFFALDDRDECETFKFNWGGSVSIESGIQINSSCPDKAVVLNGNAKFCAPSLKTNGGGIEYGGNNINIGNCGGKDRSGVDTNAGCKGDPYRNADFEFPDFQNPAAGLTRSGSCGAPSYFTQSSGMTDPGIYYGGLTIDGAAKGMNPGTYYVVGGGVVISPSSSFDAIGVTIVNTADPGCNGDAQTFGKFEINSSANFDLSAPTSGPLAGMALLHRSILPSCEQSCDADLVGACTNDVNDENVLINPSAHLGTGSFYAPNAHLEVNPNAHMSTTALFIGHTILVNNSGHFDVAFGADEFYVGEGADKFILLVE